MQKSERVVAIGLGMVDEKLSRVGDIHLPNATELIDFLFDQKNTVRRRGGVTPNIISTLVSFVPEMSARLLSCTGRDVRGRFYRSGTDAKLGRLQTSRDLPTGVVASLLDDAGTVIQRERYLGAAEKVTVDRLELEYPNKLLISDLTTLRLPEVFDEATKMLSSVKKNGGDFFLNLAGLNPDIAPPEEVKSVIEALPISPDIVTGNKSEFFHLTGHNDLERTIAEAFPNTRLLILTLDKEGLLVRFEGEVMYIPPFSVPAHKVKDETGAGDTLAGIMLGSLYQRPYNQWDKKHVGAACQIAAFGASLVVKTFRSRLSTAEMQQVRNWGIRRNQIYRSSVA